MRSCLHGGGMKRRIAEVAGREKAEAEVETSSLEPGYPATPSGPHSQNEDQICDARICL